jgi:UDP-3-O-acyl-N-acetylglucosamine deacetylase
LSDVDDAAMSVLEVVYEHHPQLDVIITEKVLEKIKVGLFASYDSHHTWPIRLARAILANKLSIDVFSKLLKVHHSSDYLY